MCLNSDFITNAKAMLSVAFIPNCCWCWCCCCCCFGHDYFASILCCTLTMNICDIFDYLENLNFVVSVEDCVVSFTSDLLTPQ